MSRNFKGKHEYILNQLNLTEQDWEEGLGEELQRQYDLISLQYDLEKGIKLTDPNKGGN